MTQPPTQYLKPRCFDESETNTVLGMLEQLEKRGVDVQRLPVREVRIKVQRMMRTLKQYGFDASPYSYQMIDSIIRQRRKEREDEGLRIP